MTHLYHSTNRFLQTTFRIAGFICLSVAAADMSTCFCQVSNTNQIPIINVQPADESTPVFRYRLHAAPSDLKPGAAGPHAMRALVEYGLVAPEIRGRWEQYQKEYHAGHTAGQIDAQLVPFKNVFAQLTYFGEREDLSFDSRWRDLRGAEIWELRMSEMTQLRDMARLLKFQAIMKLKNGDFVGAMQSIRTGYRLAEFLGHSESVIQSLVGSAIAINMTDAVEQAIGTPGCPNLYWALATLPRPVASMRAAIELEMTGIERTFPILTQSESLSLDPGTWQSKWRELVADVRRLCNNEAEGIEISGKLSAAIQSALSTGVADAKKRLHSQGREAAEIDAMPPERVVALDTLLEMRRLSSTYAKAYLLPETVRIKAVEKEQADWEQFTKRTPQSIATLLVEIVRPAINSICHPEMRQICYISRLMTLEALRMHVARHGNLPNTLQELNSVPAIPSPFDNKDFRYSVETQGNSRVVTLDLENVPRGPESLWVLKARFTDN